MEVAFLQNEAAIAVLVHGPTRKFAAWLQVCVSGLGGGENKQTNKKILHVNIFSDFLRDEQLIFILSQNFTHDYEMI